MVDVRHIAVSYCIPSIGHKLNFNHELILPMPLDFACTRSECWGCGWVAESDRLLRPVSGRVELFVPHAVHDYLVKPIDIIIRCPSKYGDRWLSWWPWAHLAEYTWDSNSSKEPTQLNFRHGEKMWVNHFPDCDGRTLAAHVYGHDGPPSKKQQRQERSQALVK